ncbi:MAG: protein phosphatase 2C domain-containing protein [Gemmatimonadota bacterium]
MSVSWSAAAGTDVGKLREANEDAFRIDQEAGIFVVADGMGGHAAGEIASGLAADAALETLQNPPSPIPDVEGCMREAFREAFRRIAAYSKENPDTAGMGTTLTVGVLSPGGRLHIGHIGDSRLYRLAGGTLRQLTHDHSWVQQEVDAGRIAAASARSHPLAHVLTRVLTASDSPDPDVLTASVQSGDLLLFCSDGLYNMVDPPLLLDILLAGEEPASTVERLIDAANDRGGADNITTLVVRIQ